MLRVGVAILVVRNGHLLLGKLSARGPRGQGMWSIPGGAVDEGESPSKAALRELREETGLDEIPDPQWPYLGLRLYSTSFWSYSRLSDTKEEWLTLYFACDLSPHGLAVEPQVMEPEKCAEWRWCTLDPLREDLGLPTPLFEPLANAVSQHHNKILSAVWRL